MEDLQSMYVSTREIFSQEHPAWIAYTTFRGAGDYVQVRTVDTMLNPLAKNASEMEASPQTLAACVEALPIPEGAEYHLLAINLEEDGQFIPIGWKLLGHDLTDETRTSSLLNCGPWEGQLKPFTKRQNQFGLLSLSDAQLAQELLPIEWGSNEPHAHVVVWALYEREQRSESEASFR